MQDISSHNWIYGADKSYYSNPASFMGIPNVEGTRAIYNPRCNSTRATYSELLGNTGNGLKVLEKLK